MTAKEFDRKFWQEHNPITTPLWKMAEAYAEQQIKELKEENDKDCKYHLEVENQLQDEIIKLKQDIRSAVAKY